MTVNARIEWIEEDRQVGVGVITWRNTTPDPALATLQQQINTQLTRLGWQPIAVDGRLGPQTCGAISWMGSRSISPNIQWSQINSGTLTEAAGVCSGHSYTYPTPVGQTKPVNPDPSSATENLPWGVQSARTKEVQATINTQLLDLGYNTIDVSGVLDAATCGALQVLDEETGAGGWVKNYGGNCQSYTRPTKKTPAAPPPVTPPPVTPPPPPPPVSAPTVKKGSAWGLALLAAAAVIGVGVAISQRGAAETSAA